IPVFGPSKETRSDFRKIFHGRPKDGNFAESSGFENIVAAGRNERASDKGDVRQSIKAGKLSDAVEQKAGDIVVYGAVTGSQTSLRLGWPRNRQLGPPDELAVRFVNKLRGSIE